MSQWTALLLAGSRPGGDPFAAAYGTDLKPLIPLGGRPLVAWPAAALLAAPQVSTVRILSQQVERIAAALPDDPRLTVEPSDATIAATLSAILADPATRYPLLVTTADHVLLDPAMIADFCGQAAGADLAIGLVERRALTARLPGSKRTWLRFRGGAYSGANLFGLGSARAAGAVALWRSVEQDRKKGWRLLAALGPLTLIGAALRLRTIDQVLASVGRRLGLDIRKVELANPLAAVDVDKPADHDLVTAIVEARMTRDLAIYDMDRTVTRHATYTPFLLYCAARRSPARLALVPLAALSMLAYAAKAIDRGRLKEINHRLLLGHRRRPAELAPLVAGFAARTLANNIRPGALKAIARDRAKGRRVVMATASYRLYATGIAEALGFDDCIGTNAVIGLDERVHARIDGANCYGPAKLKMIEDWLTREKVERGHVRFYSDHASDAPVFEWADEAVAVNPHGPLRRLAAARGWRVEDWG